jgi:uncharacterized phosphosugar-binding protein
VEPEETATARQRHGKHMSVATDMHVNNRGTSGNGVLYVVHAKAM